MQPEDQLIKQRIEKLETIKKLGINPYPYSYDKTHNSIEVLEKNKIAAEQRAEEFKKQETAKPLPSPESKEIAPQAGETAVAEKFLNIVLKSLPGFW